ncbi:hypothetical protein AAHA92_24966 [Salvia divinorum]|uniref:Reverse transcriptase n=1 Tax=Salvia divinorum TaxID=28513 RepID=A0ABD1G934_SALDI
MAILSSGVGRTETIITTPISSLMADPVVSQLSDTPTLDPIKTMLEHMVASMARFETRMNDYDRRLAAPRHPARPEADPPYGLYTGRSVEASIPHIPAASAVSISLPPPPFSAGTTEYSTLRPSGSMQFGFQDGYRPNLAAPPGFGYHNGPQQPQSSRGISPGDFPSLPHPITAWDTAGFHLGQQPQSQSLGSSWDHPALRGQGGGQGFEHPRSLKMEAPRFDGSDAASWISRVQYYFDHLMFPDDHRLHYVVMLFDPPVAEWIFNYRANNPYARWAEFLEDVRKRFDPKCFVNYFGKIAKLCQTGSLTDYNKEFETMLNRVRGVPDYMLLTLYVEGLLQPVRNQVKFQYPPSVAAAIALALEFDAAIERPQPTSQFHRRTWQPRDGRQHTNFTPSGGTQTAALQAGRAVQPHPRGSDFSNLPVVRLTAAEKAERSRKGLCWYCPEKWIPNHSCKKTFLAYMGVEEDDDTEEPDVEGELQSTEVITADLSHIYAMEGRPRSDSIELLGRIGQEEVMILVDTGSSHDFLHPRIAEKLKLPLTAIRPFRVYVGNGESLCCSHASANTPLQIQEEVFGVNLHVLPIHGPDVILGMSWLRSLGRVTNDYGLGTIEFFRNNALVCLKVIPPAPREVSLKSLASLLLHRGEAQLFELVPVIEPQGGTDDEAVFPEDLPAPILEVLELNRVVFKVPTSMPPARPFDHKIHLLPNSKPINVRPYRYPYFQKTEIERQVREMLEAGTIRQSQSPFSSPVLLIRKKDGSFRFCIDYRALNTATVPDHFPIPTTDELFDELGVARFFTKLDLRAGYHQIRMHTEDIFKTAFRTHDGHFEFLVMPFGLTNAPSTFQAAMNDIFRPLLRRSVIVFFDDILIYSPTLESHGHHLHEVLSILTAHSFFVKLSKCTFCSTTVEYLGHLITDGQLQADPSKIAAMVAWPIPSTVKQLRGFLGLTGYYRRFIAGYASIAAPLTELLKKDSFSWSPIAEEGFETLKKAMTTAPVLRLPDFSKTFYLETDASDFGVGAVLLQDGHPIAFFSKKLGPRRRVTSTYHKELYAIVEAVQKWRQYLLGREFVIRSDQKSLKELLQQVIQTPDQQLYVRKLMGYKFRIEYKTGASNKAADALSRRDMEVEGESADSSLLTLVSHPIPDILEILREDVRSIDELIALRVAIDNGSAARQFTLVDGLIYHHRRIYVAKTSVANEALLYEHHSTPSAGHPGIERTFRRLAASFFWVNMRRDVKRFVEACFECQTTKYSTQKPAGLLQPLPIPSQVWEDVSMDFITGLPQSKGYTVILVVVDRLSKYAHFAPLPTRFDAWRVANLFVETVVKHHGFPKTMVSDRDPLFLNEVWEHMLRLSGTKQNFTTAYHPQSDGQTEVRNRGLEQYLRAFVADRPSKWSNFLPWAELALNCFFHEGLGTSPFHALYGREPPALIAAHRPLGHRQRSREKFACEGN